MNKTFEAVRNPDRCPTHPGALVAELLEDNGLKIAPAAKLLGVSRRRLGSLLSGTSRVSPDIAARLGKLFGNGSSFWLRMQAAYDTWRAEREFDTTNIPTLGA